MAKLKCPREKWEQLGKIVYEFAAAQPRKPADVMENELAARLYDLGVEVVENDGSRRRFDPKIDKMKIGFDTVVKGVTETVVMMPSREDITRVDGKDITQTWPQGDEKWDEYWGYIGSYYLNRCR